MPASRPEKPKQFVNGALVFATMAPKTAGSPAEKRVALRQATAMGALA